MKLTQGVYDHLITDELQHDIQSAQAEGLTNLNKKIDEVESLKVLTEHISSLIYKRLSAEKKTEKRIDCANDILKALGENYGKHIIDKQEMLGEMITTVEKTKLTTTSKKSSNSDKIDADSRPRPLSGFRVSNLFTGGHSALSLSSEIERDIVSADRISLIISFLKLSGVNLIFEKLKQFCNQDGHQLRIITTTYCGVTEGRALERLLELPNTEIRISYQTRIERLHAKSYIFERNSGMSTAYIGSSNLSRSAQTDGLEWNIRVTSVENPHIIKTAIGTFDQYWESPNFEDIRIGGMEKFYEFMERERDPRPKPGILTAYTLLPHQKQILDKLQVERGNGVMRNLIVAATGTGKTVISAFDFKAQQQASKRSLKILFIAHREEILRQALATYQSVLMDANFGELWTGNIKPQKFDQLFVSVQTFNSRFNAVFSQFPSNYYDYVVIDEAHHAEADSYANIFKHFTPTLLVGLTATPERMDGKSLLPDFCGKISAEIRLPKAMEAGLLTPFHYYCISDNTDLSEDDLMNGGKYITSKLSRRLQTNQRASLIMERLGHYLSDERNCKALCFCADKEHAMFMASKFQEKEFKAAYLTCDNNKERKTLNRKLASGEINYLFVVDMFNEGVDIPEVDTVLFLRPTESLTIFLQQLGRGLRLSPGKNELTVFDFVSQLNKKYDYVSRFRSLMTRTDRSLADQVKNGFTLLPYGCSILMEEKAQRQILENIQSTIYNKDKVVSILKSFSTMPTLSEFLTHIEQDVRQIYKNGYCWTYFKKEAGMITYADDENTKCFQKGFKQLIHINTPAYLHFVQRVMKAKGDISKITPEERPYALMLYYALYQQTVAKAEVDSVEEALARLKDYPFFVQEIVELTDYLLDHLEVKTFAINEGMPPLLEQYGCYTREEVFTLFGIQTEDKKMQGTSTGVFDLKGYNVEAFFVTLNKSDKDFSPSTQYDDYVISEQRFHWQSQNSDSHAGKGERFVNQRSNGKRFLLFVRDYTEDGYGNTCPFYCLGFVHYVRSSGDCPMNIEWDLEHPILPQFIKAV